VELGEWSNWSNASRGRELVLVELRDRLGGKPQAEYVGHGWGLR
jgi:hypothetical protein